MFCLIHRLVGGAQQPSHVGGVVRVHGNSDGERDRIQDRTLVRDVESVCSLANIAYRLNRPLKWDPVKERFEGDEEANRLAME